VLAALVASTNPTHFADTQINWLSNRQAPNRAPVLREIRFHVHVSDAGSFFAADRAQFCSDEFVRMDLVNPWVLVEPVVEIDEVLTELLQVLVAAVAVLCTVVRFFSALSLDH
jgi:hypothetical protein